MELKLVKLLKLQKQLEAYSTVHWQNGGVKNRKIDEGFCICIDGVYSIQTKNYYCGRSDRPVARNTGFS